MVYTGFGQRGLLSPSKGVLSGTNYLNQGYRNYTTRRNADINLISIQIDPNILTMLRLLFVRGPFSFRRNHIKPVIRTYSWCSDRLVTLISSDGILVQELV